MNQKRNLHSVGSWISTSYTPNSAPMAEFGGTMESEPCLVGAQAELFVRGERLTTDRRSALRAKLKAGELDELVFSAVVFRDGPNSNHTRFRQADLSHFAASFVGMPFLRNHAVSDIGARDGTILSSLLVGSEFRQEIRLTTERGMRSFLEGVIDRFSIGWYFEGVECGICGGDWMQCNHWPGQKVDGQVCELIFMGPRGKETSAVNAPAVQGTRVIEQLCQLKVSVIGAEQMNVSAIGAELLNVSAIGAEQMNVSAIGAEQMNVSAIGAEQMNKERGMPVEEKVILLPDGSVRQVEPLANSQGVGQRAERPLQGDSAEGAGIAGEVRALRAQMDAERVDQMIARSGLTEASKEVIRLGAQNRPIEAQRKADGARLDSGLVRGIRPVVTEREMTTPLDRVQSAWNWIWGAPNEPAPPPSMRSVRDIYLAVTGRFNPEWSQLAAATTTTLAGLTVNALNKVMRLHYDNMATYRWYENIVAVDAHDGSTQNVQLIMMDGIANLPVVQEGAAYTEATVGDSKESMAFTKRGHYVGITLESLRRSDIARLQAVPRLLIQGAIRSRSAAIAGIFTVNSATGPTLADDSTVLFHANHGNTATTVFGDTAWAAARTRIFRQTVPGTSLPLGLWPKYGLFPMDLYDTALTLFGYGSGDVGKPGASFGQSVNPYGDARPGDPRPIPIVVPDWTDTTNWAYIVDPMLQPVIHMAYANMPQGGQHALPEIFDVTDGNNGLMFTNDTMPVKIRDWWGYGVSTYVGIGNNIVAG